MQVRKEHYDFTKRPLIKLKSPSVIITQGSPGRVQGSPYPEGCEMIAVNLRHVWSSRGWFSEDMKDYLALEPGMKLLLLTSTHDDVLERAWENEVHTSDFAALGFDYWQCIEFSAYGNMSRYHNLWASYRCLAAHEASKPYFCSMPSLEELNTRKPGALDPWTACAKACPQTLQNWQFTSSVRDPVSFKRMMATVKRSVDLFPAVKATWFVGVVSGAEAYNITRNLPDHICYFLAVNPWLAAFKGDEFSPRGKLKKSKLPRRELVIQNQLNYHKLILDAVLTARSELKQKKGK